MMWRSFIRVVVLTTVANGWTRPNATFTASWQAGNQLNHQPQHDSSSATSDNSSPEFTSRDQPTTFRVNVKLVMAKVTVRDHKGHAVGNLRKEDFEIFDNGKPQVIAQFSVEEGERVEATTKPSAHDQSVSSKIKKPQAPSSPERYIAYLFDDAHLKSGDIVRAGAAAARIMAASAPTDRSAIFSTSGETLLDFTDDVARFRATSEALRPHPIHSDDAMKCPDLNLYMADLIANKHDREATLAAINEVTKPPVCYTGHAPLGFVEAAAARVFADGEQESRAVIAAIKNTVRRLSLMPGERSIVLVSPGFLIPGLEYDNNELIDIALRAHVIISAIDARGLYVVPSLNPEKGFGEGLDMDTHGASRAQFEQQAADRQKDVLAVLANNTGGRFFFNSNDMDEGFRRLGGAPDSSYVLGFVPQDLKLDGKYHKLKVKLRTKQKLRVEARDGYFSPKSFVDPSQQARQELEQAMFSGDELEGLPVQFEAQVAPAQDGAKLSVLTHLDIKPLHFKKSEGRNCDVLTVASLIFDRNGNYLLGTEKTVALQLKNETLEHNLESGVTLKTSFYLKPGKYVVRVVVREEENQFMFAKSTPVDLPAKLALPASAMESTPPKEHASDESRTDAGKVALSNAGEIASNPWVEAKPYLDGPFPKLRASVPELKGLEPASDQEQLISILDRAGNTCVDLLSRVPNLISREEITSLVPEPPLLAGYSLKPYIGIQSERFDYLLLSEHTASGIKLKEYRMVHGRAATTPLVLGQLSEGVTSEWLRLYPGNRSESRFRYLGQEAIDHHQTYVLGFAQIPQSVKFPARFQLEEKDVPIFLQGVVWIDSADFRIVRMREDLLAPRPDIGLQKLTTSIRFGEVNIRKAESSLWLPQEVVVEWEFHGQTVQRRHRYSDYRLYSAKTRILPAAP